MPNKKYREVREKATRAKRARARKRERGVAARKARRVIVLKVLVVLVILAMFLALALLVGDDEYKATIIGWVPFVAAVAAIIGAFIYIRILKHQLTLSENSHVTDCQRGDDVRFDVRFRNKSPLFVFRMEAYFYISDLFGNIASESMTTMSMSPFEETDMGFDTTFEHVGNYTAGLDRVVVSDFLGLFTFTLRNERRHHVNVTPRLVDIEQLSLSTDAMRESNKAAKSNIADSLDYSHVRAYEMGDALKTIHWKLSARTGSYQTRLYEVYTNPGVAIICNFFAEENEATQMMSYFDAVVECAFSLSRYSQHKGMETELFFSDKDGRPRQEVSWRNEDLPELIEAMPKMSNRREDQLLALDIIKDQVLAQHGQNNLIVCSADLGSELVSALVDAKIRRRSPMLVAVVPAGLDGRALDAYCSNLSQLDAADIPYIVLSRSEELAVKCV